MNSINITPQEAKKIIQDAQEEILESYDWFVDGLVKWILSDGQEMIQDDEREQAENLLESIGE